MSSICVGHVLIGATICLLFHKGHMARRRHYSMFKLTTYFRYGLIAEDIPHEVSRATNILNTFDNKVNNDL